MMETEFLLNVVAQFPTFMGLLLLAYIQFQDSRQCESARDRADQRYHDLVRGLIATKGEVYQEK